MAKQKPKGKIGSTTELIIMQDYIEDLLDVDFDDFDDEVTEDYSDI